MPVPPIDLAGLPTGPGVYRFIDDAGRVMYIGRAVDLRRRVRSYFGSLKGRPRMRRMVPQIARVEVVACASEHESSWLERNLLEQRKPRWNRARGGLEVPVYLRLDPGPRAPSLTAVHDVVDDLTHFGPYLGGTRVRTAVSALGSVHPLAYSGERMTGSEASMAAARGVGPGDRPALVVAVTGVLSREPEAVAHVRAALEHRRGRAATELEFELAGRCQEQLDALDWLVSEQRVTTHEGPDALVAGWADGVLVEFGMKAGRLRTWTQKVATREQAEKRLVQTPDAWVDFAQHNAELAARLHALHPA